MTKTHGVVQYIQYLFSLFLLHFTVHGVRINNESQEQENPCFLQTAKPLHSLPCYRALYFLNSVQPAMVESKVREYGLRGLQFFYLPGLLQPWVLERFCIDRYTVQYHLQRKYLTPLRRKVQLTSSIQFIWIFLCQRIFLELMRSLGQVRRIVRILTVNFAISKCQKFSASIAQINVD